MSLKDKIWTKEKQNKNKSAKIPNLVSIDFDDNYVFKKI